MAEDSTFKSLKGDMFYPPRGTVCTQAFSRFLTEYHANLDLFFFVVKVVGRADENRVTAAKVLASTATNEEERLKYEKAASEADMVLKELVKHSWVQSRNLANGIVGAFQRYFSSIIQQAAQKRPEVLSSSQTIRVDDVLRFKKHKDLVSFIIDRKINDLSYGGLLEMETYFKERLGVAMFQSDRQRSLLRLFIETRNINVHNGGVVNDIFVSRVGKVEEFPYSKGKRFHVDLDALVKLATNAMDVALAIDLEVGDKFRLKKKSHQSWRKETRKGT